MLVLTTLSERRSSIPPWTEFATCPITALVLGFLIFSSVGWGTGLGFGSLLLEHNSVDCGKKCKIGLTCYPSSVEPYNPVLAIHALFELLDVCIDLDNELPIRRPTQANIYHLIVQVVSSLMASSSTWILTSFILAWCCTSVTFSYLPRMHQSSPLTKHVLIYFKTQARALLQCGVLAVTKRYHRNLDFKHALIVFDAPNRKHDFNLDW